MNETSNKLWLEQILSQQSIEEIPKASKLGSTATSMDWFIRWHDWYTSSPLLLLGGMESSSCCCCQLQTRKIQMNPWFWHWTLEKALGGFLLSTEVYFQTPKLIYIKTRGKKQKCGNAFLDQIMEKPLGKKTLLQNQGGNAEIQFFTAVQKPQKEPKTIW